MNLYKHLKTYWVSLAIVASLALIFAGYLDKGTFYVDDWGFINNAILVHHQPVKSIQNNFSGSGFRPVTALVLPLAATIFHSNFALVAIFSGLLYLSGVFIAAKSFYRVIDKRKDGISLLRNPGILVLFLLPIISTTFIFGPLTHIATTLSVLLWSLSFYFIIRAAEDRRKVSYILSTFFITLGLLCYEIFLPLLVFNVAAYLYIISKKEGKSCKVVLKHLGTVFIVIIVALLMALLYQKKVAVSVLGEKNNSRYNFLGFDYLIRRFLLDWYKLWYILRYDLLVIIKQSIHLAIHNGWIIFNSLLLTALAVFSSYKLAIQLRMKKPIAVKELWWWMGASLLGVAATVLMISFSLYPISLEGYLNRVLFPIWFIFAFSWLFLAQYVKHKYLLPVLALVIFVSSTVFQAELRMFIKGSEVRTAVNNDLGHKLSNLDHSDYSLLAYVPRCVPGTLMNEDVFSEQWDVGSIAEYQSKFKVRQASVIQAWDFTTPGMLEMSATKMVLFGWFTITPKGMPILFYTYNQGTKVSSLLKINNYQQLELLINNLRAQIYDNCKSMTDYGSRVDHLDSKLRKVFPAGPAM